MYGTTVITREYQVVCVGGKWRHHTVFTTLLLNSGKRTLH